MFFYGKFIEKFVKIVEIMEIPMKSQKDLKTTSIDVTFELAR